MSNKIIWLFIILASSGIGIAIAISLYWIAGIILRNRADKFKAVEIQQEENSHREKNKLLNKILANQRTIFFTGGGAILFSLLSFNTIYMPLLILMGASLGLVSSKALERLYQNRKEFLKTKEVSLLYECVDLFANAGYTVRQSLQLSMILVPNLRKSISDCIDRYPSGPLRALDQLGRDIGVKNADMLSGILMQAEESGTRNIKGIMEQEAIRLEELRESLAESRIAAKPIYTTVYLFLPVASVMGIIIAPLAYRAILMINSIHAGGV